MTDEPPYEIEISAPDGNGEFDTRRIADAVCHTLKRHKREACRISVALVSDLVISHLHKQFMNVDGATDVITFDLGDDTDHRIEGEIVISYETAARESTLRGVPVDHEIMLYAIHGTLHLLGHDDAEAADAQCMHDLEDEILTELGAGAVFKVAPK